MNIWALVYFLNFLEVKIMQKITLEKEIEHMFREDLIVACQYWGIDVGSSSSGDSLMKMLAEKMKNKEARERIFATFTEKEIDLLGMLVLNGGAMSYDRLKPYRKIYSYGQLNQTERDLRKKGLIIRRMMSRLTEFGREVAEFKILDFFMPILKQYFSKKPKHDLEKPKRVKNIVNNRDTILLDSLLLVSYLAKNEVKMTSSWEFPKREMDHIKEAMSDSSEERFELVQKIARKAGAYVIVEKDRVIPGKVEALFDGRQDEVSSRILLSALGRTRAIWATPDQPTEYTLNLVICRLRESTTEDWIQISELKDWIRTELFIDEQPLKWIQVSEERVIMALETPLLLGLVEGAYKGKKLLAIRLTEVGASVIANRPMTKLEKHETFFVQPNFEITVFSSEMNYYKLYQLMLLTEPVKTDVVSTCKITENSIFQAIEINWREAEILEFLETESSKPVPANVLRSIKDWTSRTIFATLSNVTIFETENEQDLEDLLLIEDFTKHVVKRLGPQAVILRDDTDEFIEELQEHRCHIRRAGSVEREETEPTGTKVAEQVLLYGEQALTDIPDTCFGCPALQSCNRGAKRKSQTKE